MPALNWFFIFYGVFLLTGAYFGMKAKSTVSLIMGLVFGALVLLSTFISRTNPQLGYVALTFLSGFLTVTFVIRFIKTMKVMPSGMLLAVSAVAFVLALMRILQK